jgi:hypothetical protein
MSKFLEGIRTVKPSLSFVKPKSHLGGTAPVRNKRNFHSPFKGEKETNEIVKGVSQRLHVGYADTIGLRDSMEDAMVVCGTFRDSENEDFFGVFDGHSGSSASIFVADVFR